MSDLLFQNFQPTQSIAQPLPVTIASTTAAITPTTRLTFLTGTQSVTTITPPVTGYHELVMCFTDGSPGAFATSGNVKTAYQPIQNRPVTLYYDPSSAKYWVMTVA